MNPYLLLCLLLSLSLSLAKAIESSSSVIDPHAQSLYNSDIMSENVASDTSRSTINGKTERTRQLIERQQLPTFSADPTRSSLPTGTAPPINLADPNKLPQGSTNPGTGWNSKPPGQTGTATRTKSSSNPSPLLPRPNQFSNKTSKANTTSQENLSSTANTSTTGNTSNATNATNTTTKPVIPGTLPDTDPAHYRNYSYVFHIVPHTHDDAGWLAPYMSYYTGIGTPFMECVTCELDKIFELLTNNKGRVFSYVEMIFFEMWFNNLPNRSKERVKELVATKQLYFPNAGYVMNDEACTYYEDIIDQFIIGHRFVHREFNYTPTVGFAIDPFGHSSTHAYLLAQMGMNMASIGRIHYKDLQQRKQENRLAFVWVPDENFPEWNILGRLDHDKYNIRNVISNSGSPYLYSGGEVTKEVNALMSLGPKYSNRHVYWQLGDDFSFSRNGAGVYNSIESYVKQLNGSQYMNVTAMLSSPENYAQMWYDYYNRTPEIKLSIKNDDFFPYADEGNRDPAHWTGYFTSRANLKGKMRTSSWFFQSAKKLLTGLLFNMPESQEKKNLVPKINRALGELERAVALVQHHDGITGTAMASANKDYYNRLTNSSQLVWDCIIKALEIENLVPPRYEKNEGNETNGSNSTNNSTNVTNATNETSGTNATNATHETNEKSPTSPVPEIVKTFILDGMNSSIEYRTILPWMQQQGANFSFLIRVYNPGHSRRTVHKVKVPSAFIKVFNASGNLAQYDVFCTEDYFAGSPVKDCDLYIYDFFPSYSSRFYTLQSADEDSSVQQTPDFFEEKQVATINLPHNSTFQIHPDNKTYSYSFCEAKGRCLQETVTLDYNYYRSYYKYGAQNSGIYIMRLLSAKKFNVTNETERFIYQGKYVTIIKIVHINKHPSAKRNQVVMTLQLKNFDLKGGIEINTFVNSWLGFDVPEGRELVLIAKSHSIRNRGNFATDSNGLKMIQRTLNRKPDYEFDVQGQQIEANYYPITAGITITDQKTNRSMGFVNDRPQGATSVGTGEIEIMIYRRIFTDDQRGNPERLDEREIIYNHLRNFNESLPKRVRCTHHYLFADSSTVVQNQFRKKQLERDTQLFTIAQQLRTANIPTFNETEGISKKKDALPPQVEASIRHIDSEFFIRLVNLHDTEKAVNVTLVEKNGNIPLLSHLAGLNAIVTAERVEEVSLNTILSRKAALEQKFKFREVGEISIEDLLIKDFSNFTMRPLELLTFKLSNVSINSSVEAKTALIKSMALSNSAGEFLTTTEIDDEGEDTDDEDDYKLFYSGPRNPPSGTNEKNQTRSDNKTEPLHNNTTPIRNDTKNNGSNNTQKNTTGNTSVPNKNETGNDNHTTTQPNGTKTNTTNTNQTTGPKKNTTGPKNTTDPKQNTTEPKKNTTEPKKNTTGPNKNTTSHNQTAQNKSNQTNGTNNTSTHNTTIPDPSKNTTTILEPKKPGPIIIDKKTMIYIALIVVIVFSVIVLTIWMARCFKGNMKGGRIEMVDENGTEEHGGTANGERNGRHRLEIDEKPSIMNVSIDLNASEFQNQLKIYSNRDTLDDDTNGI